MPSGVEVQVLSRAPKNMNNTHPLFESGGEYSVDPKAATGDPGAAVYRFSPDPVPGNLPGEQFEIYIAPEDPDYEPNDDKD